jgi:hypothetical protein
MAYHRTISFFDGLLFGLDIVKSVSIETAKDTVVIG